MAQTPPRTITAQFDLERYSFVSWFAGVLGVEKLHLAHDNLGVTTENYQAMVTKFRALFEERFSDLAAELDLFFLSVVEPIFGKIVSRQPTPTPRTHFAVSDLALAEEERLLGELGPHEFLRRFYVGGRRPAMFHRDRDYGLETGAINLWLPLTEAEGTNSLWIGGPAEKGADAAPVSLSPGECLFFDGANRWHGVVWNTSGSTRMGFDIRFIPQDSGIYAQRLAWADQRA